MDYTQLALLLTLCLIGVLPRREHADSETDGLLLGQAMHLLEEAQVHIRAGDDAIGQAMLRQAQWLIASVVSGDFGMATYTGATFSFDYPKDLHIFRQDYEQSVIVASSAAVAYKAQMADPTIQPGELAVAVLLASEHFPSVSGGIHILTQLGAQSTIPRAFGTITCFASTYYQGAWTALETLEGTVVVLGAGAPDEADDLIALITLIAETFET